LGIDKPLLLVYNDSVSLGTIHFLEVYIMELHSYFLDFRNTDTQKRICREVVTDTDQDWPWLEVLAFTNYLVKIGEITPTTRYRLDVRKNN
jgi:hypothetical protein